MCVSKLGIIVAYWGMCVAKMEYSSLTKWWRHVAKFGIVATK